MTVYALTESGARVLAADIQPSKDVFFCPVCHERVSYVKQGQMLARESDGAVYRVRSAHFRHARNSECAMAKEERERESAQHIAMKSVWREAFADHELEVFLPSGRRADLVINATGIGRASVECQYSPIGIDTVSDRIDDHNSDGLPVAWSFAPHHLTSGKLDLFSGPMEAVMAAQYQTFNVSPEGQTHLSHVFCDVRYPNTPAVVNEPIDLPDAKLIVSGTRRRAVICESDEDRVKWETKRRKLSYWPLMQRHAEFHALLATTRDAIGDKTQEQREEWRKLFLSRCDDRARAEGTSIPVGTRPKDYIIRCNRQDQERLQAIADAEETERLRKAAERLKLPHHRAVYIDARMDIARKAIEWITRRPITHQDVIAARQMAQGYGAQLGVDFTGCATVGDAWRRLLAHARAIVGESSTGGAR